MSDAEVEQREKVLLLYLGVREGNDVPRVHAWVDVTSLPNAGEALPQLEDRIYGANTKKKYNNIVEASPGAIYEFDQTVGKTSIWTHTGVYKGRWNNTDEVARLQAESRAVDLAIDFAKREAKENAERIDLSVLEPIAQAYRKAVGNQKHFILADVIRYISTRRPK